MFKGMNAVSPKAQDGPVVLSFVTLLMIPRVSTLRIKGSFAAPPNGLSIQYTSPLVSVAMPEGNAVEALVASPPSPDVVHFPFPANTLIFPFGSTFRIRQLPGSGTYRFPFESTATTPA